MQLKIVFTGPESSGKTTISKSFAELVTGKWVAEFAREYLQKKNPINKVIWMKLLVYKEKSGL